jgi:hypothetical protein
MGVARLLAKGWIVFCLFAGGLALGRAVASGGDISSGIEAVSVCTALFSAMGLLFVGGYGLSARQGAAPLLQRIKSHHFLPGFNEIVFLVFVALSLADQLFFAPFHMQDAVPRALQSAILFAVPGERALAVCGSDGGRLLASSFAWLLAIVYLASAASRLKLTAGIIRLERNRRPEPLGAMTVALVLGIVAVVGIQLLVIGTGFAFVPCGALSDIAGALLTGLAPLMLAYLIVAALASAMAVGEE